MVHSILVAIDDSQASRSALDVGVNLAKISGAKVKGLYVEDTMRLLQWQPAELIGSAIGVSSGLPQSKPTEEQIEIEREYAAEGNLLKSLFEKACGDFKIQGNFSIMRGKVDEVISQASRTVDIVVIGRRGRSYPIDSMEPGPVTENLLRHATRPVLVVPVGGKLTNKILFAYDGSETAQRALSAGAQFAKILPAEVEVVSVADDIDRADNYLNEAKEFLLSYKVKATYIVEFGSTKPWKGIMDQAKNFEAGLIVIGAFGSNMLMEMIFGSTTREILSQATCPVLLCK